MNGIDSITERIIEDARHRSEEIKEVARRQCDDIKSKSDADIEVLRREIESVASEQGKLHEEQILCNARLDANKQIVGAKRAVIDECFAKALKHLENLSKQEYDEIIGTMLSKVDVSPDTVVEQIGENAGFIVKQGKITLNYSFAEIAKTIRPKVEPEISKLLWQV